MKVIINADDFGYSNGVNYGIIDAYKNGILTSTTCLTNMPGFTHAIKLAKANPGLGVGIHLALTCGKPLTKNLYSLVDSNGDFRNISHYDQKYYIDVNELYDEWKAQIEKFLSTGLTPTHLDSHHHVNNLELILPVFLKLATEYQLPIRNNLENKNKYSQYKMVDYFEYHPEIILNSLEVIKDKYKKYDSIEIMCHPAYIDKFLRDHSSFVMPRIEELDFLTSEHAKEIFNEVNGITLINYSDL
ncbi:chitin disaccharide deacetylase [Mammaliicoccus vitulinus]|uniref:chitin disaccharide deacetylase n=1 Tax=Mammaliicoccus vitulinus TaxID=71237 RepID=UPI00030DCC69|nr:chitin disaccharide deacetylase [Mammaliicoccus vitulinus]QJF26097.1 chitin disaccharide deacetylase [Mammaliicoccus vitulinus]QTN11049.1 chitin disaccharide deacetylase [Mammaliicoccus vitulinus]RIN17680.1 chitin disaccharide deacetylase [Mammaliicoccus vitulinus]